MKEGFYKKINEEFGITPEQQKKEASLEDWSVFQNLEKEVLISSVGELKKQNNLRKAFMGITAGLLLFSAMPAFASEKLGDLSIKNGESSSSSILEKSSVETEKKLEAKKVSFSIEPEAANLLKEWGYNIDQENLIIDSDEGFFRLNTSGKATGVKIVVGSFASSFFSVGDNKDVILVKSIDQDGSTEELVITKDLFILDGVKHNRYDD